MFISFEGLEGSGKSTLLASVEGALRLAGHQVLVTREPGGTAMGDAVRRIFLQPDVTIDPLAETLLINASRAQLLRDVIAPALRQGSVVLCDRYVHSTLAYQGFGRGLALDLVERICEISTQGLMPDLTLLVDVDYETSRRRVASRGVADDRLERENGEFHRRIREGFLQLARTDPRVVTLDGRREPQEVLDAAMAALSVTLP